MEGYDFKQDKKKNKDPNAPKVEPKKREEKPVEEREKVFNRQGDPEINLQKLMTSDWDPKKYLSTSFLAKENANIVFIGHVDSGKSTLTGNIMKELK
jgi:polynucleotide 5'-kinase involved in rRNA processing